MKALFIIGVETVRYPVQYRRGMVLESATVHFLR
jgi:hypothetical protein